VVNSTRVRPARLRGHKASGGRAEALLVAPGVGAEPHRALVRCRGRLRPGLKLHFKGAGQALDAEVIEVAADGECLLAFPTGSDPYALGEIPLPPYVQRPVEPGDAERYQTVYARVPGSVAAPTAGLHLSDEILDALDARGVRRAEVVLHVGPGTFRPLREEDLREGRLHREPYELPEETARAVAETRRRGGRVVGVGTTSARVLEACAEGKDRKRGVRAGRGDTRLFLRPGPDPDVPRPFAVVDALLTNFHLPRSSLLLLVAAFAGRRRVLDAYAEAVRCGYRFYSYGDAMLIR
jgi:S-adenosylmethionine:tRNA ribosyltransferase-isomerase